MAGALSVFAPASAFIDGRLDGFLAQAVNTVIAETAGPLRAALVLYVLLYGVAILRGAIAEPMMDFAVRSVKLALIHQLATTAAYGPWVTQPLFHALPAALARAIGGAAVTDAGAAFDQFFNRTAYLGDKIAAQASLGDWLPLVMSGAVWICGALAAALGFGVVVLAKVALAVLAALGPIFIGCALFEATRRYFFGWLSQAVNYLILFALILLMLQLVLAFVGDRWPAIDGDDPMAGGLLFIAVCLLGAIFFLQTPAIAAGIAGGASLGLADFGQAVSIGLRSAGAGFGGATVRPPPPRPAGGVVRPAAIRS